MLKVSANRTEVEVISKIAKRAARYYAAGGVVVSVLDICMDIEACHANGCPLDLTALLESRDELDFMHDVCGIGHHLDHETGELKDCFVPRFAL